MDDADKESLEADAERALQNALLQVLVAVQSIDHIPNAMYDFEVRLSHMLVWLPKTKSDVHHAGFVFRQITSFGSMEAMQSDGAYVSGLQSGGAVRV